MPSESTHPVNAAYFKLAFTTALKLKLLGADLLIREPPAKALFMLPDRRPGMKQHDRDRRRAVRTGRDSGVGQPVGGPGLGAVHAGLWRAGRDAPASQIHGLKQLVEQRPGRVAGDRRAPVCLMQVSEVDAVQPLLIVV
jgi:hypothetical protein